VNVSGRKAANDALTITLGEDVKVCKSSEEEKTDEVNVVLVR